MNRRLLFGLIILFFCGQNIFAQSVTVNIDEKKQQFLGAGGTADSYMYVWSDHLSEENFDKAAQMVAKDINLKFVKNYINGTPEVYPKAYTRFAKIIEGIRKYNPDIKVQISIQDLPDELEMAEDDPRLGGAHNGSKGRYNPDIPDVFGKIAQYYLDVIKGFHAQGVQVDQLDLLNEPGGTDIAVYLGRLYSEAIPRLKALMADQTSNPDGLPMPEVLGTSQWSVSGTTRWFDKWKAELPEAYEQVDVVTTHGYRMGWYEEEYRKIYEYIDGKPFQNNEQTGKLQVGDGLYEVFEQSEPDYIGDVSMAMRISDAVNGGVDHFFIFNLNNTSGNNAALIRTTKKDVLEKSKVYDGFRHVTSLQPDGSFCLDRDMHGMEKNRVLCYRKDSENEVYVNITNITKDASTVSIDMRDLTKAFRGIKSVQAWVSDETKDIEETFNQTYNQTVAHIDYEAGPYSVNTLKITFTDETPEVMGKKVQTIDFAAIEDQPYEKGSIKLTASASSASGVVYEIVGGQATLEGDVLTFTQPGEVKVKAKHAGDSEFYSASAVQTITVLEPAEENIAEGKTTQASSVFKKFTPNKAVDGDESTASSRWISSKNAGPHSIEIDLDGTYMVDSAVVISDEAIPADFELQYNTGTEWKTLVSEKGNTEAEYRTAFEAKTTTSVRLYSTASSSADGWIKIFEIKLYGEKVEKKSQTIDFSKIDDQFWKTESIDLSASATSKLPVTFEVVSGNARLEGNKLIFTGLGKVEVKATQEGNEEYDSAEAVVRSFTIIQIAEHIAVDKAVTASSQYAKYDPENAVDGDLNGKGSRWISEKGTENAHWLEIDLAGYYKVDSVVISSDATAIPEKFEFQYWNGTEWKAFFTEEGNAAAKYHKSLTKTETNRVRFYSTASTAPEGWVKIFEIELYGEEIKQKAQEIKFKKIEDQAWEAGSVELEATVESGLEITFEVIKGEATIEGSILTFTQPGELTVKAIQAGNRDYEPASAERSFIIKDPLREHIAKGKDVTASSKFKAAYSAENTVDGDVSYKLSRWITEKSTGPHWLEIDLSDTYEVDRVVISADDQAIPTDFELQYWNGTTWEALFTETGNTADKYEKNFAATSTNKVRFYSTASSASEGWLKIYEIELYGKRTQTIDFVEIADQLLETGSIELVATASSKLEVAFELISGKATLEGNTLKFTEAGEIVVKATQAGNSEYKAAEPVVRSFVVKVPEKKEQTIEFTEIADQLLETGSIELVATASSKLEVAFELISGKATLEGSTLKFTEAGEIVVKATQAGNSKYKAAEPVVRSFVVKVPEKKEQAIEFKEIADQLLETGSIELVATASSKLEVIFELISGKATLEGNKLSFTEAGEIVVKATQAGNSEYKAAEPVVRSFVVKVPEMKEQTIEFKEIADQLLETGSIELVATATSKLEVAFEVVGGKATLEGNKLSFTEAGEIVVKATQAGNSEYKAAEPVVRSFMVKVPEKKEQTIEFKEIADQLLETGSIELVATATSKLEVAFEVVSGKATLEGNKLSFTEAGEIVVKATQAGNSEYKAAEPVVRSFVVTVPEKQAQRIVFAEIGDQLLETGSIELVATATSKLEVAFEIIRGKATLEGNKLSFTEAGVIVVKATQAGNSEYEEAVPVVRMFMVKAEKKEQTIEFVEIEDQLLKTGSVELVATASSGLEVTFEVVGGNATLEETTLTFIDAGEVTVKAIQEGNDEFKPASAEQTFLVSNTTSVASVATLNFTVYPNPTSDILNVSGLNKEEVVKIYSLRGVLQATVRTKGNIDVSGLRSGIYTVVISGYQPMTFMKK